MRENDLGIISNKDESIVLFKNGFVDTFSRVRWFVPLIIFLPVIAYFLYQSISTSSWVNTILFFLLGVGIWTLTEYVFHRFIFHYHPSSKFGKKIHFIVHGVHHAYPSDSLRLVMPPALSIPLSLGFFLLFRTVFTVGYEPAFAGFIFGYLSYDMIHYAVHHVGFIKVPVFKKLKHHHMKHHFNDPDHGFGVSSTLWDIVGNTKFSK